MLKNKILLLHTKQPQSMPVFDAFRYYPREAGQRAKIVIKLT